VASHRLKTSKYETGFLIETTAIQRLPDFRDKSESTVYL